jgi:hypothetical protein
MKDPLHLKGMFPALATVVHVEEDGDNNRFYAKAELIIEEDLDRAELHLPEVVHSVHATVLMNAKTGRNTFNISGKGDFPFAVGDKITVTCFPKGDMPPLA